MFKQEKDWKPELRHEVRNGKGDVTFNHIYAKGTELNPNMRLFAKLVLEPGCSIGWHVHENEDEIYANGEYLTERITRKSVDFIQRHKDEPFFF